MRPWWDLDETLMRPLCQPYVSLMSALCQPYVRLSHSRRRLLHASSAFKTTKWRVKKYIT